MNNLNISTLQDCYNIYKHIDKTVFGVGVTAFMRIIPGIFLKEKFGIICYKRSLDLDIIIKYNKIFCLQDIQKIKLSKLKTSNILKKKETQKYIKENGGEYLMVYKNNADTEKIAKKIGLKILAPKNKIRSVFENKKEFRNILNKLEIETINGENIVLNSFLDKKHSFFTKKYGKKIVIQLPDIKSGGGVGTFFINSNQEFLEFQKKIMLGEYKDTKIKSINITRFVTGVSSSIIGCATKYGTFSSSIQTQLIDIPEAINLGKGSGLFCGHDRSLYHFSNKIQKEASIITEKLGNYMYSKGYKGIFGIDLIIDIKNNKLYIVECNSRYTGAFPMISLLDIKKGIPPMDIFHILEHAEINYNVDFENINKKYKYKKEGSHIILTNKENKQIVFKKDLKPGIYTYQKEVLKYKRPGLGYNDIKTKNEFIIIDGNPKKGEIIRSFSELSRFCHLLFPGKIALSPNKLNIRTKKIISNIYADYLK